MSLNPLLLSHSNGINHMPPRTRHLRSWHMTAALLAFVLVAFAVTVFLLAALFALKGVSF
jgi:hypothetical protein